MIPEFCNVMTKHLLLRCIALHYFTSRNSFRNITWSVALRTIQQNGNFSILHGKYYFHTSSFLGTVKKTRAEKKAAKNIITFNPKSKQPTVQLWKGVTLNEIAMKIQRSLDDVLEAVDYLEEAELYQDIGMEVHDGNAIMSIAKRLGYRVEFIANPNIKKIADQTKKDLTKRPPPKAEDLVKRPPVVTIMGHVDHGKTTLLDSLRHSSIVSQEHGGITQHIGAFTVKLPEGQITFLDTPGHAAFKAMRARGANVTDIVILVVAADDGIMEQTLESIRFAREAKVPIIVAINKIDKPQSDIEMVQRSLLTCGLQVEALGGDIQAIPISALKKTNLDQLIEAIVTLAEVIGVGGDPTGPVEAVVLEASLDTAKGKVSTALIQRGTLKKNAILVSGVSGCKVRAMLDDKGANIKEATPGTPVQVYGWKSYPVAGDIILQAESEKVSREVLRYRESKRMEEKMASDAVIIEKKAKQHLDKYRAERQDRLMRGRYRKERKYFREKEYVEDDHPFLAIVVKGDVHGSVEAIEDVIQTYHLHYKCRLDLIHSGVGTITENDLELAECFEGVVYGFNVTVSRDIIALAQEKKIVIKLFNVIYHMIDDIKLEINKRLPLMREEDIIGEAVVLQEFTIKDGKKKVPVAGCKCVKGSLLRSGHCKVIRSETVLYDGPIVSLRHEKASVESIKRDVECGLMVEDLEVAFKAGDTIICYSPKQVTQLIDWNPGF